MSVDHVRPAALGGAPEALGDAAIAQVVTRLSGAYVLRTFQLLIDAFGDIRMGLIAQAINTANIDWLTHTEEGRRAAGPDGVFPNELRRPISIARLADSAGLPFETVRRIVQRLLDYGVCKRVEGGVIVPSSAVQWPKTAEAVTASVGYIRRFAHDLQAVGLEELTGVAPATQPSKSMAAAQIMVTLSMEYVLRALRLLADTYGDIRLGIVAQTIVTANTAHLDTRTGEGWRYAGIDEPPPDDKRKPVSVARLAESVGLPYETMRARVRALTRAGTCIRVEGGLIVPTAVLETPAGKRAMFTNAGYLRKLLRDLHSVGL
jgi:DNA-binding Lrp family transcriptional regulator